MVVDTGKLILNYPVFILPLLVSYTVLAGYTYLMEMTAFFEQFTGAQTVGILLFLYSFTLTFTGSLIMEWVQHIENGYSPRILAGLKDTLVHNLPRLLPIAGIWMTAWLIVVMVEILINFAIDKLTFGFAEKARLSAVRQAMDFLRKGIRMFFFMNIPAVGWQGHGPISSLQRSWQIVSDHYRDFGKGYLGTYFVGFSLSLMSLTVVPLALSGTLTDQEVRLFSIFYGSFVATVVFFLEQLFAGKLYLKVLQFEKLHEEDPSLNLSDVEEPDFHDDVPDFRRYR